MHNLVCGARAGRRATLSVRPTHTAPPPPNGPPLPWQVNVVLDSRMLAESQLSFHPMTNQASTLLSPSDLLKWVHATGHSATVVDMAAGTVVRT